MQRGWGEEDEMAELGVDGEVLVDEDGDGEDWGQRDGAADEEEPVWDIDTDASAYAYEAGLDSGLGRSEDGYGQQQMEGGKDGGGARSVNGNGAGTGGTSSPMRRGPSLLDL